MKNWQSSIELDMDSAFILRKIADKSFEGQTTKALNWILRTLDRQEFYRRMAQFHQSQVVYFREMQETDALLNNENIKNKGFGVQICEE